MPDAAYHAEHQPEKPEWYKELAKYEKPDIRRAFIQLCNTLIPLLGLLGMMLYTVTHGYPYWITLGMSVVAAGFLCRTFIFFHDCTHGSFFPSQRANAILGFLLGVLMMTPYGQWRWSHLKHHASFANLDRRGVGDVKLMTVDEYQAASRWQRLVYRWYRHPFVLFGLGSTILFAIIYRFPIRRASARERRSVWLTDGALLAMTAVVGLTVGFRPLLLVLVPVWFILWMVGVWIFYIQHQFEGVYWARQAEWDFFRASLEGSSYYRLPKVLQWFTGNIGLHHVHHLRPRIPNYSLQQAYDATPAVQAVKALTLRSSLKTIRLNLYDERRRQMVSFHALDRCEQIDERGGT
jgi:omega-6 fatty acid desaturase (delta-12 desaturase)